jgi:murein DD-endopeptidase MepM/ murein hydrolase activator NlpD
MQKNDKFYTFLLKHSSKSKIYIRRIEVSKSFVHFGSLGIFLLAGIAALSVGVSGIVKNSTVAASASTRAAMEELAANQQQQLDIVENTPASPDGYATNSGGPESSIPSDPEDAEIANQINTIKKNADPLFLPTVWAHTGKINNEFGFRRNPFGGRTYEFHPGMDIDGERGQEVLAPANGTVIKAAWTGGYGNMLEIDHGNGLTTRYGHLSKIEVEVGDTIKRGQLVALIGSTGRSTGPHLHFELRLNDKAINPRFLLPPEPVELGKKGE